MPTPENEYFLKQEAELLKQMRRRAEIEAGRRQMAESLGVADQRILDELQALGYDRDTVALLHLAPLVQVAWVDGHLSKAEADRILDAARSRNVQKDSPAYRTLSEWLTHRPSDEFFQRTLAVIRDILLLLPDEHRGRVKLDLVACCTDIATASGGLLGLGPKISAQERSLLASIAAELEQRHAQAAKVVVDDVYGGRP